MAGAPWPAGLPQCFSLEGYSIQPRENVIREQMDVGPPKVRRRASVAVVDVTGEFKMTAQQRLQFDAFYRGVLFHGTRPFVMRDPDGVLREYYVQSVSYSKGRDTHPLWRVQLQLWYID